MYYVNLTQFNIVCMRDSLQEFCLEFRKTHVDRLLEQKTSTEAPWWIMHAVPTL